MPTPATPHILVPLGLAAASEAVLGPMVAIATAMRRRLTLLHVVAPAASLVATGDGVVDLADAQAGEDALITQARDVLAAVAQRLDGVGVAAATEVVAAPDVAAAIVERVRRDPAITMAAMALRDAPTFRHRAVTSVARDVVSQASVPVLLVRSAQPAQPLGAAASLAPILVPLDGSALAERALAAALEIATATQAILLLVAALPTDDDRHPDAGRSRRTEQDPDRLNSCPPTSNSARRSYGIPAYISNPCSTRAIQPR